MPLSRSNRIDRRRRVMLDAVAADSEFAVESVRAKKRARARENSDAADDDEFTLKYRDPGYSQAVRKTCQQRMVQLIPVRRGTLSIVLTCMWILWATLLFSHYWIFTRYTTFDPSTMKVPENASSFAKLPIAQLLHLRSSHSIAQWLTCQLWMLTAVAAWMIFQLRRHKLDDYRARYRIWVVLAIAAFFSSFEASSSGLLLLGLSIDGWAQREIGYAGWPLVLATYASIIGVIGIRLCSELKSAPMSVVSWLVGLLAWGFAALLGTGLFKITWSPATVDLVVGGCLLGGILAVFQAAGIYLRQTYIHAQKRFLVRNGANLSPIQWKVPKLSLRRTRSAEEMDDAHDGDNTGKSKWKMPWARKRNELSGLEREDATASKRESTGKNTKSREIADRDMGDRSPSERTSSDRGMGANHSTRTAEREQSVEKSAKKPDNDSPSTKPKGRLFGIIPNRQERNEKLDAEPIGEDDGPIVDKGLTKKRGWFGIGGNRDAEPQSPGAAAPAKPVKAEAKSSEHAKPDAAHPDSAIKSEKRSFWSRGTSATGDKAKPTATSESDAPKTKRGWVSKFSKSYQQDAAMGDKATAKQTVAADKQTLAKESKEGSTEESAKKKSWLSFGSSKPKEPKAAKPIAKKTEKPSSEKANSDEPASKSGRRGLFGMLDGLKLKPPTDEVDKKESAPVTKPVPIKQGQSIPSTQSDNEDDGDDDYSGRPMSKADRKKLRRQGLDDRRAA